MQYILFILVGLQARASFSIPAGFLLQEGPCWESVSPDSWPVKEQAQFCGEDGILYPSKNAMKCSKPFMEVKEQEKSKCVGDKAKFDACNLAFVATRKICGSDNVTYSNVWDMICTSKKYNVEIKKIREGECDIECPYSPIYKPVCSANNLTYANEEALQCRRILKPYMKVELRHSGKCEFSSINPCHEANFYTPACASNGRTYASVNHIRCLKPSNPNIKLLHDGACTVKEVTDLVGLDKVCEMARNTFEWAPLCSNTNVTYSNAYTFLCASKDNKELKLAYKGECGFHDVCRDPKKMDDRPTCGNNGVTYPSDTAMHCASKLTGENIYLKHHGECEKEADDPCKLRNAHFSQTPFLLDDSGFPVCGSNGVTYVTTTALWCAAKSNPDVKFFHAGECF